MGGSSSKKEFKIEDIPELSTKTILVTGGNAGIGKAIAKVLASKSPAKLIIAGRSQTKVNETVSQFQSEFPSANVVGLIVDLSSFKSIETFGGTLAETVDRVDILVNNAGIFLPPHSKTTEGFEITLGTNAIGVAYLTRLVIPLVLKSPAPRVVFLGSNATSYVTPAIFSQYIADIGGKTQICRHTGYPSSITLHMRPRCRKSTRISSSPALIQVSSTQIFNPRQIRTFFSQGWLGKKLLTLLSPLNSGQLICSFKCLRLYSSIVYVYMACMYSTIICTV